ncbi:tRNA (adenine(22)-N(1))-methyltransferase TrmK [Neptunomonas japonica]|uniref:tRNA (adenine(22)-N(1))-methyltransferase TrmK n=1 Tax=Neptunomonas japonica TaxID=417574 RepID=UPI00042664AD|nr:tRNA (adenine(22)-N(1))-methyltransferase TrmK [Neptunomonas japonica]
MKISQRLQQIDRMITKEYEHIWDCCCDHGLLGFLLLQRSAAKVVHFVDIAEPLVLEVETKLQRFFPEPQVNHWQVHAVNVAQLRLAEVSCIDDSGRHLMIIAGVGGELLIELVEGLLNENPQQEMEFLLCPILHTYKVRNALILMGFYLIDECLVKENNRYYEILHVSLDASKAISPVGSIMWDFTQEDHQAYLKRTLGHYQRVFQTTDREGRKVLEDYQALSFALGDKK